MSEIRTKEAAFHSAMLHYFNRKLLERNVITQDEFHAMKRKIRQSI